MDFRDHLRAVQTTPGMFLVGLSTTGGGSSPGGARVAYGALVAYVLGLDVGADGRALDGFQEFVVMRSGGSPSIHWSGLIPSTVLGHEPADDHTPPDDQSAVEYLFEALDEFFAETQTRRGRLSLSREYTIWQAAQTEGTLRLQLERYSSTDPGPLLAVNDACAELSIDRRSLFDLVADGKLRARREQRQVLFTRADVERAREFGL
jgi:hypothetical protein